MRKLGLWEPNPPKNIQVLLKIINPVTNTEMLAPELVGDQSEIVVQQFFTQFSYLCGDNQEAFVDGGRGPYPQVLPSEFKSWNVCWSGTIKLPKMGQNSNKKSLFFWPKGQKKPPPKAKALHRS